MRWRLEWEVRAAAFRSPSPAPYGPAEGPSAARQERPGRHRRAGGGLLALGVVLAIAEKNIADVVAPVMTVIEVIRWAVVFVSIVWGPLLAIGPWLGLLGHVGGRPAASGRPRLDPPGGRPQHHGCADHPVRRGHRAAGPRGRSAARRDPGHGRRRRRDARPRSGSPGAGSRWTSPCRRGCRRTRCRSGGASSPRT